MLKIKNAPLPIKKKKLKIKNVILLHLRRMSTLQNFSFIELNKNLKDTKCPYSISEIHFKQKGPFSNQKQIEC